MDDLDALLEDLQAVVPRSERPAGTGGVSASASSSGVGSALSSQSNGYSPAVNGSSGNNMLSSSSSAGGGPKMVSPITHASTNLAELDSLLESLNSPSLGMDLDEEALKALGLHDGGGNNPLPPHTDVDSLLADLDLVVSVPKPQSSSEPDVRDAAAAAPNFPPPPAAAVASTSAATRDLDALMASLNDFQLTTSVGSGGSVVSPKPAGQDLYAEPKAMMMGSNGVVASDPPSRASTAVDAAAAAHSNLSPSQSSAARLSQLDSMLGNLQSDISRQGITNTSKGTCSACQNDIVGQVITALGRTWHPQHFTCVCCKEELATKTFFERDGQAYCEKDYHEKFAPKCAYCAGPILNRCMTALGKTWHPEHFFCSHCGKPFGPTESFHEKDGKPYCRDHYYELFAPKCGACERPIIDSFVSALKKQWHPECFNCMECGEAFKGGNFFEHDLMPYCEQHYYNRQGATCAQCKKAVTGRCITAMGQKFHPEHFVCVFCMKQLSMGTFKEHDDRPYCMKCYGKLFG